MAAPSRTLTKRESDLELIAKLDRRGYNQFQIAEKVGISQPQVSYDLKQIRERYKEKTHREVGYLVEEKLAQYRELRAELWEAWERSKEDQVKHMSEQSENAMGMGSKDQTTREGHLPSGEYAQLIMATYKAERELLGTDKPVKSENETKVTFPWDEMIAGLKGGVPDQVEAKIIGLIDQRTAPQGTGVTPEIVAKPLIGVQPIEAVGAPSDLLISPREEGALEGVAQPSFSPSLDVNGHGKPKRKKKGG